MGEFDGGAGPSLRRYASERRGEKRREHREARRLSKKRLLGGGRERRRSPRRVLSSSPNHVRHRDPHATSLGETCDADAIPLGHILPLRCLLIFLLRFEVWAFPMQAPWGRVSRGELRRTLRSGTKKKRGGRDFCILTSTSINQAPARRAFATFLASAPASLSVPT